MAKNHEAICFDLCDIWVHVKCNKTNIAIYTMQNVCPNHLHVF